MWKKNVAKEEFERLFRAHYEELFVRAFSILGEEEEAHDVVHEAFARLWQRFPKSESHTVRAFLYVTVRNLCIDSLRRKQAVDRYREWWLQTDLEAGRETEEQEERLRRVEKLLAKLPPLTQKILEACFFRQRTYRETGQELGVSESTVKYQVRNALRIVRDQMKENE